jgi:hypothetical protein
MKYSLFALITLGLALAGPTPQGYLNYTTISGYFLQDEASTIPAEFDFVSV